MIHDWHYSSDFDWNLLKFLQSEIDSKRFRSKHVWFFVHLDHHFCMFLRWKRNQKISHRDSDINKIRNRIHARYDWCWNEMRFTLTMNTAIMIQYQRTWNRQIEIKQNRMKKKLMNKIKRIVQMNVNIHLQNMNVVIDSFCDDVEDLESKKKNNRSVNCQESIWLFDKKILFLIMSIKFLFVENHR
jgi:hypothetical protein